MIKAIIFDCFGVIYPDTLNIVQRQYLHGESLKKKELQQLRLSCDYGRISRDKFWDESAKILGVSRRQLDTELDKVRGADWELLEYIKCLKKSYKTAIVSNVGVGFLEKIFDKNRKQSEYFDEIIESGQLGIIKPDPRIYLYAADSLGISTDECIFIDDRARLAKGAEDTGMKAIVYKDFDDFKIRLENLLK